MKRRSFLAGATAVLCLAPSHPIAQTNSQEQTMQAPTDYAIAADGTKIAYWTTGKGPKLIVVAGAFNDHNTGAELVADLSKTLTVITYDRRGRGLSGDASAYSPEKEVADLRAVFESTGGDASALGFSSGASLVLMAASEGVPFERLVLIEAPWMLSDARPRPSLDVAKKLRELANEGKQGDAVELFQRDYVGIPEDIIVKMRNAPYRPMLEKMALTTSYDAEIMGDLHLPDDLLEGVSQPTLLLSGEKSPAWMAETGSTIASRLSHGKADVIDGVGHDLTVEAAPQVRRFLAGS